MAKIVRLALIALIALLTSGSAYAQVLDPQRSVQAYTTADPNNDDRLGLATPDGRYSISLESNCSELSIAAGQDVQIFPDYLMPPWLAITASDGTFPGCTAHVIGRMSNTPCFTDDNGVCEVSQEGS
jgi:hypothetical protein